MKTVLTLIALLAGFALNSIAEETGKTGTLRHVVALKFKEGTAAEEIKKVEDAFRDLKKKIPQIAALEWGTNNSPEKHAKGFTHCFVLTFKSEKDRDVYLPHPDHKAFGKILGPVMADVFVIDYWAKE
jgi:hypothetical protein